MPAHQLNDQRSAVLDPYLILARGALIFRDAKAKLPGNLPRRLANFLGKERQPFSCDSQDGARHADSTHDAAFSTENGGADASSADRRLFVIQRKSLIADLPKCLL